MKKNVEMINVNLSFLKWLLRKLNDDDMKEKNREEIKQSVRDLMNGTCSTLILEADETEEETEETEEFSQKNIVCRNLQINVTEHRVIRDGEDIFLTPKEFDILYFLAKNKGVVFTKEQIYQAVWEKDYLLDDSNIMAFIRKIRKKIEYTPDEPEYIITIWGIGYKFNDRI